MIKYPNAYEEANKHKKYFLAITRSDDYNGYDFYFVNCSNDAMKLKNEGVASMVTIDEDVYSSSTTYEGDFIVLEPKTFMQVGFLDEYDLDCINQFYITLIIDGEEREIHFTIGRRIGFLGNLIPILNKYGRRIYHR